MTTNLVLYQTVTEFNRRKKRINLLSVGNNQPFELKKSLPEILFITSFPPRECGIATYSQDLIAALNNQIENSFQ